MKVNFIFFIYFLIQRKNFFFLLSFFIKRFDKGILFRDPLLPQNITFPNLNFSFRKTKLSIFYNLYKNLFNNSLFFFQNNSLFENLLKKKNQKINNLIDNNYLNLLIFLLELFFFKKKMLKKLILNLLLLEFYYFKQCVRAKTLFLQNPNLLQLKLNKFKFINFFFKSDKIFSTNLVVTKENKSVISETKEVFLDKKLEKIKSKKKKKFKSYLYELRFPRSLHTSFYFKSAFKKLIKEHEDALKEKKKLDKKKRFKKKFDSKFSKIENLIQKNQKNTYLIKNSKNNPNLKKKMSTFIKKPKKINSNVNRFYDIQIFYFFSKLVNLHTKNGHKKKSLRFFLDCFSDVRRELKLHLTNKDILTKIFFSLHPYFILKKFNLKRRALIIPFPITKDKRVKITSQIFLTGVKRRSENTFKKKVIEEIKDFYRKKMPMSVKFRNERIKIAIENKNNIRFLKFFK